MSERQVALQRLSKLFQLAKESIRSDPELAQRYVGTARRIGMRTRIHLPRHLRLLVCRHCKSFILPGVNCRVRSQPRREAHVVITCLVCGKHMRIRTRGRKRIAKA